MFKGLIAPFAMVILALPNLAGQGPAGGTTNDFLIVPGMRVGPVTATIVRDDLKKLFPGVTISDQELELDEGMVFPATMVAQNVQGESLAIVWTGKGADAHPKQVFMCRGRRRGACKYHALAPGGDIATGTKLLDLETMNGRAFTIGGFGWTYGGNVTSWDGGKLQAYDCDGSLSIALDGERKGEGALAMLLTEEERATFTGNRPIPTTTPALRKLNPAITEMLFIFPAAGTKPCRR